MSAVELIGGEMTAWSDRRPGERPAAGGSVLTGLLQRIAPPGAAGRRVLIAGPHDDALADTLSAHGSVTWLLRSRPDAEAAARRGVHALCGSLAKLTGTGTFDLVVALDGLDRLCSAEGPQLDWPDALQALRRTLRPGGTLLLTVPNELGVHRLVDPLTATSPGADGEWRPLGEFDETRPGAPDRLIARLHADGLTATWLGTAWPGPARPALLATPDALRDGPSAVLAAHAARAFATAYAGRPVLSDPRRLAAAAVRNGLAAELAPAWIVLARAAPTPGDQAVGGLPAVLLDGDPPVELVPDGPRWRCRDDDRPLPTGRLLEELLISACLRHDLASIRRLLTGWAAWSGTEPFDNVVVDGDTFTAIQPATAPGPSPVRRFAETLILGGYAHPWPGAADADALTAVLSGATDRPSATDRPDDSAVAAPTGPPPPDSRREHHEQLRALEQRLADARAQLQAQETELASARRRLAFFEGTPAYRAARLVRRALRPKDR